MQINSRAREFFFVQKKRRWSGGSNQRLKGMLPGDVLPIWLQKTKKRR